MSKILTIVSAKGGVGKTTVAVNVTAALNNFGRNVILVEGNPSKPNVSLHLGTFRSKQHQTIVYHPSNIPFVSAPLMNTHMAKEQYDRFKKTIQKLKHQCELVVLDAGSGFDQDFTACLEISDAAIIVTTPDLPAVIDSLKTKYELEKRKIPILGVIVNKYENESYEVSQENIYAILEQPILGVVPYERAIKQSLYKQKPIVQVQPENKATMVFKQLAAGLIGEPFVPTIASKPSMINHVLIKLGLKDEKSAC